MVKVDSFAQPTWPFGYRRICAVNEQRPKNHLCVVIGGREACGADCLLFLMMGIILEERNKAAQHSHDASEAVASTRLPYPSN